MPKETFFNLPKEKQDRVIDSAVDEFSQKYYEQVNLSDIIRKAGIPRGSFYQYFEDKKDLYLHLVDITKNKKIEYLGDAYSNPKLPFLDTIALLYKRGIQFALDYPKLVEMFEKLLHNQNEIYEEIIASNKHLAIDLFKKMIIQDQENGLLRKDLPIDTLANLIYDLTINVTVSNLDVSNPVKSYQMMETHIHHIIDILRKGIYNE